MPFAMQQRFPPPLLVFDLDGTLADTAGDLVASLNVILAREGLAGVEFARARAMVGGGARALIQSGLSVHGITVSEPRLDAMLADFLAYYEAHVADETALFPGVARTLDRFEAAGFTFAVCTNKVEYPSVLLLTALGIAGRFRAICGKDTFPVSKPNGDALLQTIARAGGDRGRAVMIGEFEDRYRYRPQCRDPCRRGQFRLHQRTRRYIQAGPGDRPLRRIMGRGGSARRDVARDLAATAQTFALDHALWVGQRSKRQIALTWAAGVS